jgi:hypothetical protein
LLHADRLQEKRRLPPWASAVAPQAAGKTGELRFIRNRSLLLGGLNRIRRPASVAAVMRAYRVAAMVVLLLAFSAAGALALRRPVRSPVSHQHGFAMALSAEPDGDGDGGAGDAIALRPALERAPRGDRSPQRRLLRALQLPARDPIPLWRRKLPASDDDPFARG